MQLQHALFLLKQRKPKEAVKYIKDNIKLDDLATTETLKRNTLNPEP